MPYQPAPTLARPCAFCGTAFTLPHRRRIYCSNSCNTRACVARKAAQARAVPSTAALGAPTPTASSTVTLAVNVQNVAMLAFAPKVPKVLGAVLQFVGDLLTPAGKGPNTWLPAELRQPKQPLVAMTHESWEEPRFFVVLPYGDHTLYYRAAHNLLVLQEDDGSLRQLRSAAELATLLPAPKTGIQTLLEQHTVRFAPVQAAPLKFLYPYAPVAGILNRLAGEGPQEVAHFTAQEV